MSIPIRPDRTATAEGQTMTQVLRTLNRTETSRFEAYRRATFSSTSISDFLAHLLTQAQEQKTNRNLNHHQNHHNRKSGFPTKLHDIVDQAEEITLVTSTLAKVYAQRLVTAARRVATAQGCSDTAPLLPQHVMEAHHARQQAGIDPGFFMTRPARSMGASPWTAAALGVVDRFQQSRAAALQAQEDYDNYSSHIQETPTTNSNVMDKDMEEVPKVVQDIPSEAICNNEPMENIVTTEDVVVMENVAVMDDVAMMENVVVMKEMTVMKEELPVEEMKDIPHIQNDTPIMVIPLATKEPVVATTNIKVKTYQEPMSMEDALLLDMDDDDDSSDEN